MAALSHSVRGPSPHRKQPTEGDSDPAEASGRSEAFRGLRLLTPKPLGLVPGEGTQAAG